MLVDFGLNGLEIVGGRSGGALGDGCGKGALKKAAAVHCLMSIQRRSNV
jgi:hypothetical protein